MVTTTSDTDMIKADILRKVVYKAADGMLMGKNALPLESISVLDIKYSLPEAVMLTPQQITEGELADIQNLEWFDVTGTLLKYQTVIRMTDEAKARQLQKNQIRASTNAAAKGMAYAKDAEIFTTLTAGAGNSVAATAAWGGAGDDPIGDIVAGIGTILDSTYLTDTELQKINLFCPVEAWAQLTALVEVNNITQSYADYIKKSYKIGVFPTRQLDTNALLVVNDPETGYHLTYNGNDVPLSEKRRVEGVADDFIITQLFKTIIFPDSDGGTTSSRIYEITGVVA